MIEKTEQLFDLYSSLYESQFASDMFTTEDTEGTERGRGEKYFSSPRALLDLRGEYY